MSKHLMDSEKLREMLESLYDFGYDAGYATAVDWPLRKTQPTFENWYAENEDAIIEILGRNSPVMSNWKNRRGW